MITAFLLRSLDRKIVIGIALLLALAVLVPALNLLTAPTSALHIPTYIMSLFGKYLTYALLALALDLVWGFCGILSLGHGAFFALGGYAMGMYLMRQIGARGSYGNPILPDFMVFLNYKELPWFWYGFDHFWVAAIMVLLGPGLLAFVFGWFAFRSRVNGVYLSIITQAMTYALLLAFFRNDMGFGGNNGLTDFKDILGFNIQADGTRAVLFAATAIILAFCLMLASAIVRSKYGKVLIGVRDAESRVRFLGFRVENMKLFTFVVSAMMAGIAGALYVPQVGIINPGEFAPANSIEVVIWTAVGGRATLVGPIIGAILVNGGKTIFTGLFPEVWLFALGLLFVAVTLFLPKGIVGTFTQFWKTRREYRDEGVKEKAREQGIADAAKSTEPQAAE
jgi:urea transport system permease protein